MTAATLRGTRFAAAGPRSRIEMHNCTIITPSGSARVPYIGLVGGKLITSDPQTISSLTFDAIEYQFEGTTVSTFDLLRRSLAGVENLVNEIVKHL